MEALRYALKDAGRRDIAGGDLLPPLAMALPESRRVI